MIGTSPTMGTQHFDIQFISQSPITLYGFCEADQASFPMIRSSTTIFCIFLGGNCISWCSKNQPIVSRSSLEAQYRSMAFITAKLAWLSCLLQDIGITLSHLDQLFRDNISALHMFVNPMFHARSKYIELNYHFM